MTRSVLAAHPHARRRLGRVVPLHQGRRRRRLLARGADVRADADRRRRPARLPRGHDRRCGPQCARAPRGLAAVRSCSASSTPRRRSGSSPGARSTSTRASAGIAQATVPIFSLLIGLRFLPHERIGAARIAGVVPRARRRRPRRGRRARGRRLGRRRDARRRARLGLLRLGRDLQPAARLKGRLGAGARDGLDARGQRHPACRSRSSQPADIDADDGSDRVAAAARTVRHGARAADPLPGRRASSARAGSASSRT